MLLAFLKLGLTAFGGPIAHLGYFRTEFVERRGWLDDASYGRLVALCQFLPGPTSSQVGMAIGQRRAGPWGALAAWAGFTLPSALLLIGLAHGITRWPSLADAGWTHGLKIAAAAVVAHAVWAMARSLCTDQARALLAVGAAGLALTVAGTAGQLAAIALGALAGHTLLKVAPAASGDHHAAAVERIPLAANGWRMGHRTAAALLALWAFLLLALPLLATWLPSLAVQSVAAFYQAGSLVFGGGHVVLPLLQASVAGPGWVSGDVLLAGYGAAQAMPGPLFSFAAYLGAVMAAPMGGAGGGLLLLGAIFLPAFLLVAGALPFWESWLKRPAVQRSAAGIGAAVVGLLAATLIDPVTREAITSLADAALALVALALLLTGRLSPVWVVGLCVAAGGWLGV